MDLNQIKEIIKADKGKLIIMEDGKPVLVIMDFADYAQSINKNLSRENFSAPASSVQEAKVQNEIPPGLKEEPLKIEDLPF